MAKFKGFKEQIKAIEKAVGGRDKDKEPKSITELKKKVLKEQLKQLKMKKAQAKIQEVKRSILSPTRKTVEEKPRNQMIFLRRI